LDLSSPDFEREKRKFISVSLTLKKQLTESPFYSTHKMCAKVSIQLTNFLFSQFVGGGKKWRKSLPAARRGSCAAKKILQIKKKEKKNRKRESCSLFFFKRLNP